MQKNQFKVPFWGYAPYNGRTRLVMSYTGENGHDGTDAVQIECDPELVFNELKRLDDNWRKSGSGTTWINGNRSVFVSKGEYATDDFRQAASYLNSITEDEHGFTGPTANFYALAEPRIGVN